MAKGEKNARNNCSHLDRSLASGFSQFVHHGRIYSYPLGYRSRNVSNSYHSRSTPINGHLNDHYTQESGPSAYNVAYDNHSLGIPPCIDDLNVDIQLYGTRTDGYNKGLENKHEGSENNPINNRGKTVLISTFKVKFEEIAGSRDMADRIDKSITKEFFKQIPLLKDQQNKILLVCAINYIRKGLTASFRLGDWTVRGGQLFSSIIFRHSTPDRSIYLIKRASELTPATCPFCL